MQDETRQINNLKNKYIMELSKLKHLQFHITNFELEYIKFKWVPKIYQISTTFQSTIEEVFETLETAYVDI